MSKNTHNFFSTPILLIIFNRPDTTLRVFNQIREVKPSKLFIAADGPREDHPEDLSLCSTTRSIIQNIDWECEVKTIFRDKNLGCRTAVSDAISWFFSLVDKGIILEDDCLPNQSFFAFCEELLEIYKDNQLVMSIGGNNFFFNKQIMTASYSFAKYPHIWGWATWRRAWIKFHSWDLNTQQIEFSIFPQKSEKRFWLEKIEELNAGRMTYTWDYQWSLVCMAYKGLCIYPKVNLVSNIGFGDKATHTKQKTKYANLPTEAMKFPLIHPKELEWNQQIDTNSSKLFFRIIPGNWFFSKIKNNIYKLRTLLEYIFT